VEGRLSADSERGMKRDRETETESDRKRPTPREGGREREREREREERERDGERSTPRTSNSKCSRCSSAELACA